LAKVNFSVKKN
jgi:hypothetical protein